MCRWNLWRGFISAWNNTTSNHTVNCTSECLPVIPSHWYAVCTFHPRRRSVERTVSGTLCILSSLLLLLLLLLYNASSLVHCSKLFSTGLSTADVTSILLSLTFFSRGQTTLRRAVSLSRGGKPLTPKTSPSCPQIWCFMQRESW